MREGPVRELEVESITRLLQPAGLSAELRRLDGLLAQELHGLRRRGRSPLGEMVNGAVIEDGEAEGLLRELMEEHRTDAGPAPVHPQPVEGGLHALVRAAQVFDLGAFERDVILLALAVEIDSRYGRLVAYLNDHADRARPTVGLVAALFGGDRTAAHAAFLPGAALMRFGLVALEGDGPLSSRAVRLPESFWPRLVGGDAPPAAGELRFGDADALGALVLADAGRARAAAVWLGEAPPARRLLLLTGPTGSGRETLACALAFAVAGAALVVRADGLDDPAVGPAVAPALRRETRWHDAVLVVVEAGAPGRGAAVLLRELDAPAIWVGAPGHGEALLTESGRQCVELPVDEPSFEARVEMLSRLLPPDQRADDLDLRAAAARFRFGPGRIETAVRLSSAHAVAFGAGRRVGARDLSAACRRLPDVQLMSLAQRLPCPFVREDLVIPPDTQRELELAIAWGRHREWLSAQSSDGSDGSDGHNLLAGRGLACLFTGPPGTGKTMGAQVLARAMDLDLYRIDLSQVVSKYIGETEKNLTRVFDEARAANVVLFFDEADALFGKRTEIKDAHDRYANVETGFLLQRIEQHDGICILATNLRRNMDDAFLRRLHIVADFAMPGEVERRRIWQRHLPAGRSLPDIDLDLLAKRFAVSGGEIRNAVVTAVVLSAEGPGVSMRHLVMGLWRELRKAGRIVDAADLGPWASAVLPPPPASA